MPTAMGVPTAVLVTVPSPSIDLQDLTGGAHRRWGATPQTGPGYGRTTRAIGCWAPGGRAVLAPLTGLPPLISNVVTLEVVRLATNSRVPAGFTARACGPEAPAG